MPAKPNSSSLTSNCSVGVSVNVGKGVKVYVGDGVNALVPVGSGEAVAGRVISSGVIVDPSEVAFLQEGKSRQISKNKKDL